MKKLFNNLLLLSIPWLVLVGCGKSAYDEKGKLLPVRSKLLVRYFDYGGGYCYVKSVKLLDTSGQIEVETLTGRIDTFKQCHSIKFYEWRE